MKHNLTDAQIKKFNLIEQICGDICKENPCSELGGAYDLARLIQLTIYNVLEEDGSMVWKVED